VPTHTFVEPSEYARLKVALRTPGRGVVVEGPSGIGKSTAVARALEELKPESGIQMLSARDPGDVGYIELIPETTDFGVVVVDDFHVLQDKTRRDIADLLKRLADTESQRSKLIIVGINRAGDSLIEHAPDLANRVETIRFEVEPPEKVRQLITQGEEIFNVAFEAKEKIVEGAQGSFYLAQLLSHELCAEAGPHRIARRTEGLVDSVQRGQAEGHGTPGAALRSADHGLRPRSTISARGTGQLPTHPELAQGRRELGDLASRGDGSTSG
jgi:hypothetical protein